MKHRHDSRRPKLRATAPRLCGLLLALAAALPAQALDYAWLGGTGNWQDGSKWSLGAAPGNGDRVFISDGTITQDADVSIGQLVFNGGTLKGLGTLTVTGSSSFDGTDTQSLFNPHGLLLQGDANWTAGNGTIYVAGASSSGANTTPPAVFTIGTGTTFTDAGAASASGLKTFGGYAGGGGTIQNNGSYVRSGLGTTWARSFQNSGLIDLRSGTFQLSGGSVSTGTIQVAAGSTLELNQWNGDIQITAGSINNLGRLLVTGSNGVAARIASGASVNGAMELQATLQVDGNNTLSSLLINDGGLGGAGTTTTGTLNFVGGTMGLSNATGGSTLVTGATTFDGTGLQQLTYGHALTLNGNTSWTVGNGSIRISPASYSGSTTTPTAALTIGAGTTFSDAGAASASGAKQLGVYGGNILNSGTYNRDGLGETYARNFNNQGTLNVRGGTLEVDTAFVNTGTVTVSAGAKLLGNYAGLTNQGVVQGDGTVSMPDNNYHYLFSSSGTLRPGLAGTIGTLTLDADVSFATGSTLDIDLLSPSSSDLLVVTRGLQLGGTVLVHGLTGFTPTVGDSYVIATYEPGQVSGALNGLVWVGEGDVNFGVDYDAGKVTLHVLSVTAVPEPATALSLLLGLGFVGWRRRAARQCRSC